MSWHCVFCGSAEKCNGIIDIYHIGGGIPKRICCHLTCLAKEFGSNTEDLQQELVDWEKENES